MASDLAEVPVWESSRYEYRFQSTMPAMMRVTDKADRSRFMLFTRDEINNMKQLIDEGV